MATAIVSRQFYFVVYLKKRIHFSDFSDFRENKKVIVRVSVNVEIRSARSLADGRRRINNSRTVNLNFLNFLNFLNLLNFLNFLNLLNFLNFLNFLNLLNT